MNRRNIILILLSLLILGMAMYLFIDREESKKDHEITVYGNVDIRQVDLGFRVGGRIKKLNFEEGDLVKTGDVMAILDDVPYLNDLHSAQAQLDQNAADLDKKKNGNRVEEIQQAESTVKEREGTHNNAIRIFNRQKELIKSKAASIQTYDNALQQMIESKARLESAKDFLHLMKAGFRPEDIQASQAAYNLAKANLDTAQTNLDDTKLIAPSDGIIFSRIREEGAIVGIGATVYNLSLHHPVWIRAYVSEHNLGRIKPGDKALIYTDTNPDKPFKGQIGFISPQAEFTPKNVETEELRPDLVYRIRILADDPKGNLRQGMPVTVKLLIDPNKPAGAEKTRKS